MTDGKEWNLLLNRFILRYKQVHKEAPDINRYKLKWGFSDMFEDLGRERSLEVIDYYFELRPPHTAIRLFKNYDELYKAMRRSQEDAERLKELKKETEDRVREWKQFVNQDD